MLQGIATILREHCRIEPPALLVVGISGGPDSLCLMHVLHALGYRLVVAHVDHQLRPESAVEAAAVQKTAESLDLPFVLQRLDVREHARLDGLSIEEAARDLRYAFLFAEARRRTAQAVAAGHTADDQVETVLMHLIRGAGIGGLTGMSYRSILPRFDGFIPLIRPLLGTWRPETVEYCRSYSLAPVHDRSNDSMEYFRNRVRHQLIPALESHNPRVREAIWRTAETLASDLTLVEERVTDAWSQTVLRQTPTLVCFDAIRLAGQPLALQRRLVLAAAAQLLPDFDIGFASVERAAGFIAKATSSRLDLGSGLTISREAEAIYVSVGEQSLPLEAWPQIAKGLAAVPFTVPAQVSLENGWQFSAQYSTTERSLVELIPEGDDAFRVCLDADSLPSPLELRPPRPGDRLQPLGLQGHTQKLSDLFVNGKLPARARSRWPLLCSGKTLIWVPGFRPAEPFRLRKETRRAACFVVSRLA